MKPFFIVLAAVLAFALIGLGGNVAADNVTQQNETLNEIEQRIDSSLVVLDWDYSESSETFTIELRNEGDRPTQVTIQERTQHEEGAAQFSINRERILPGDTTISLTVEEVTGEAAVALTTSESLEEGTGVVLSTGVYQPGPWTRTSPGAGWLGGLTIMLGMTILAGFRHMRKERNEPEELT